MTWGIAASGASRVQTFRLKMQTRVLVAGAAESWNAEYTPFRRSLSKRMRFRQEKAGKKPEFIISTRPGIDWMSLGLALAIGLVCRYVNIRIPW